MTEVAFNADVGLRRQAAFENSKEKIMKKTLAVLLAASAVLAGCVVAPYDRPPPPRGQYYGGDRDRDGVPNRYDRDRDGDGVPNRYDRRPNNPYR